MPELPEVEVVRLFLSDRIQGRTITSIEVLNSKSFQGEVKDIVGSTVTKLTRVGKQLSIHLDNQKVMLIHLKMTGQLILGNTMLGHPTKFEKLPSKSTRLIFNFAPKVGAEFTGRGQLADAQLYFNDQRKFGWVKVFSNNQDLESTQSNLGLDIFDPRFSPEYLYSKLQSTTRPIKLVLLDQHYFAGIGNIYACDSLFLSGIHPLFKSNQITKEQANTLYHHLIDIMQQSVLAGGSTAKDNKYVRPDGTYGGNQFFFRVYQREGEPCLQCSSAINRIKLGGRGTFFCPQCQIRST